MTNKSKVRSFSEATQQVRLDEHLGAGLPIKCEDFTNRHTDRDPRCDDPAGAGSGNVVEIVGEAEIGAPALRLEQILDLLQHFEREHAADAAAVDRKQLFRSLPLDSLDQAHGVPPSVAIRAACPATPTTVPKKSVHRQATAVASATCR